MSQHLRTAGRIAIVATFLALLLLPMLQMSTDLIPIEPLDENRNRATLPSLADLARPGTYLPALQKWFQENYGLRDLLIRTKTQIDYSVFGVSDKVYIGDDGWLYYHSVIDKEEPAFEGLSDAQQQAIIDNLARLRDFLARRGIHLIIITNQMKDRFYPEHLPAIAAQARARHRFDEFRHKLHALPGVTYLDTTDELLALKASRQIFYRTDFHWTQPAAFEFARELVNDIAALEQRPPLWHEELKTETRRFSGGQANFLPLFDPPSEEVDFVLPTRPAAPMTRETDKPPFEWISHAEPGAADLLPTTILYGDSFCDAMLDIGLSDYFREFRRARLYRTTLPEVLANMPPDTRYFIFQAIEVSFGGFQTMPLE